MAKNSKIISDIVHGLIELPPLLTRIISTKQFQRLKHLKQLGIVSYVYPCATHTRFEHSLGTAHLAGEFIRHLQQHQGSEYNITDTDVLCVQVAGLLHDVGHGPFSHLFEEAVKKLLKAENKIWKHEDMSIKIIDRIYNDLKSDFHENKIFDTEIELIKDMVTFEGKNGEEKMQALNKKWKNKYKGNWNKAFLFEIVSNHRNGIDVDKFDYFERDAKYLNLKTSFDQSRYIKCSRIITMDGIPQICVRDIVAPTVYEMYHTRLQLHKSAYKHKVAIAIDHMIVDAFVKADEVFDFKNQLYDVDKFCELTDDVQFDILNFKYNKNIYAAAIVNPNIQLNDEERGQLQNCFQKLHDGIERRLNEAKEILQRIEDRKHYKLIGQTNLLKKDDDTQKKTQKEVLSEAQKETQRDAQKETIKDGILQIYQDLENHDQEFSKDELIIEFVKNNYGFGHKNPIDKVRYYKKNDLATHFKLSREQISTMLLTTFEETSMRVYCRKLNANVELLHEAFKKWIELPDNKKLYSVPTY